MVSGHGSVHRGDFDRLSFHMHLFAESYVGDDSIVCIVEMNGGMRRYV